MLLKEAMKLIELNEKGFMVSFEVMEGSVLRSDHFPDTDAGEKLIETEVEAWDLAERFAKATDDKTVNIYVIDQTFSPVRGYDKKKLKPY